MVSWQPLFFFIVLYLPLLSGVLFCSLWESHVMSGFCLETPKCVNEGFLNHGVELCQPKNLGGLILTPTKSRIYIEFLECMPFLYSFGLPPNGTTSGWYFVS